MNRSAARPARWRCSTRVVDERAHVLGREWNGLWVPPLALGGSPLVVRAAPYDGEVVAWNDAGHRPPFVLNTKRVSGHHDVASSDLGSLHGPMVSYSVA